MTCETTSYRLGDLTDWFSGGTPSKKKAEYWGGEIPWISASSMGGSRYSDSNLKITKQGVQAGSRIALKGSILLLVRGSRLHSRIPVGIIERDVAFNQDVKAIRVKSKIATSQVTDELYLYYWLKANEQQLLEMVEQTGIGAGKLDTKRLQDLEIQLPAWNQQQQIVAIATALDEQEILNSHLSQTLEEMAQAIFKSWFVDFDPVKAKIAALEAGGSQEDAILAAMQAISGKKQAQLTQLQTENPKQYNELRTTAGLFPSAMQDSELGDVPEGWFYGELIEICELNKISWTKRTVPSEIEYVDLANTKNGTIENTTIYAWEHAPSRARRKLTLGDTIIGTVRPGNRSFAFISDTSGKLTGSTGFAVLSPKNKFYAEFLYISATTDESINHLAHLADGGAYPAVRPDIVSKLPSIIPCDTLVKRFHRAVAPYFTQMAVKNRESLTLDQIKIALLPKLLSGELNIASSELEMECC